MSKWVRTASTCAGVLVSALVVTVGASSAVAAKTATSQGINGKTIDIALSSPQSGPGASAAAYTDGIAGYLNYLNQHGGVDGYTFNVSTVDNQGDAAGGATAIRQIVQSSPFLTVIDGSDSFEASVGILKSEAPDMPVIGLGNAAIIKASGLKNAFGLFSNYIQECYMQVNFAVHQLHLKKLALVYEDSPTGQSPAAHCPAYAKAQGATIQKYAVPTPDVSTDYTPIAARMAKQKPQIALFFGSNGEMVGMQKALYNIETSTKWIGFAPSYDITYLKLAGAAGIGTYFDAFAEPVTANTPQAKLFRKVMGKFAAKSANSAGGYGWSYGVILQHAIEAAVKANHGTLTQAGFDRAMRNLKLGQTGLLYSVDFTKDPSQSTTTLNIYQVTKKGLKLAAKDQPLPPLKGSH